MNKRFLLFFGLMAMIVLTGFSCTNNQPVISEPQQALVNEEKIEYITYLVSENDALDFCNGADLDSEGYRKTITKEVVSNVPVEDLTLAETVKQTAILATTGMCQTALAQSDLKVENGIVEIPAIEGWAGVSIALCSCKPEVEVNLLRIPGITQVVWSSASAN